MNANYLNKQGLTAVASFVNQKLAQYSVMPEATSTIVNKIVQYVGETNNVYTNGHFYKCSYNGAYYWTEVNLGDSSSSQPKNLSTSIDINGTTVTTVEGALSTLNTEKVNVVSGKGLSSNDFTNTLKTKLDGIAEGAEVNVQPDWNQTTDTADDFIKNKPNLGTAAAKNVPSSGNASTSQVVMGNDTRLSDARPASDVSSWAKASTKPTYTASEVGAIATTEKGANNGIAELNGNGKIPSTQLPSYVDDVIEGYLDGDTFYEDEEKTQSVVAETGKIYVDLEEDKTYRWTGNMYTEISPSVVYTFDSAPTSGSSNLVTSGTIYTAINNAIGNGVDNLLQAQF